MFMHVYKLSDNVYHLSERNGKTSCGLDLVDVKEDRIVGEKGNKHYPDPDKRFVCIKCFSFLKF